MDTQPAITAPVQPTPIDPGAVQAPWGLATMHPSYFAMVMATGIVSIASHLLGLEAIGRILLWFNVVFYIVLWTLTVLRCVWYPQKVRADIFHHGRSVGFFTTVAGTCVMGSQFIVISNLWSVAAC